MNALNLSFYLLCGAALASVAVAVARPGVRSVALTLAAVLFAIAGVLGILSVGALLLVVAVVCGVVAFRSRPEAVDGR